MSRFAPYLGILFAIILGIVATVLSNKFAPVPAHLPPTPTAATSTISIVPNLPLPPLVLPSLPPEATTTNVMSTSTQKIVVPEKITKVPPKVAETVAPKTATTTATTTVPASAPAAAPLPSFSSGNASLDVTASTLRGALVNIICYVPAGSTLHSISGSGVVIDPKGIILTNAHVAQYFLLKDRNVSCTIRTGSPATDKYEASLIYISPAWIHANSTVLSQTLPTGTGEFDFGLLAITKSVTSTSLPASFNFISLASLPPAAGAPIVIASYGAQFLESSQIQSALFPTVVFGSVKDVFTFATNSIDVLALGGSAAAQEGSSGGGVADSSGTLVGTITTSTVLGDTSTRSLDAITASYIRSEYSREMGTSLDLLLGASVTSSIADFAPQIPALESIITAHL